MGKALKVVCIVQARLGSTRFPAKIMADLCGKPMLNHVLERAKAIQGVDQVVLAVPDDDVQKLSHLCQYVYGGSEKDVLARYAGCAEMYEADVIVRVTGDCPLLAPDLSARAVMAFTTTMKGRGYLALCQPYAKVADGWDTEVFSAELLRETHEKARKIQREHVVTWMRTSGIVARIPVVQDWSTLECSVDTPADLARVRMIMEYLNDPSDFGHEATWEAWQRAGRP